LLAAAAAAATATDRVQDVIQKLLTDEDDPSRADLRCRLPDKLFRNLLLAVQNQCCSIPFDTDPQTVPPSPTPIYTFVVDLASEFVTCRVVLSQE
jgi:hypothetical protein